MGCVNVFLFPHTSNKAIAELTTMMMAVEWRIFPMPTKGETIPPARKLIAPKIAEAVPAFWRSVSKARAVEVGRTIPPKANVRKRAISK